MACPCFRSDDAAEPSEALFAGGEAPEPVDAENLRFKVDEDEAAHEDGRADSDDDKEDSEDADSEQEVQLLSYDSLVDLATEIWRQATQYLMPDEAAEATEKHAEDMRRMDTLELRDHVVASRDVQKAVEEIVGSGEATGNEVADAQRSSLNLGGSKPSFNGDLFAATLRRSITEEGKINAALFLQASNQVPALVGGLGRTFEFATADLQKKMSVTEKRLTETAQDIGLDRSEVTLQDMVERDIRLEITHAGKKAAPASRVILRLMWFLDFTGGLLQECADAQDKDLATICSKVYEETLAPRHIWLLRKAARSGMRLLPNKHVFRVRLGTVNLDEADEAEKLSSWAAEVRAVSEIMWDFMEAHDVAELP